VVLYTKLMKGEKYNHDEKKYHGRYIFYSTFA